MVRPVTPPVEPDPSVVPVRFQADSAYLSGQFHRPVGKVRAAVVLHGATGVPQSFYQPFAHWLAAQGIACLTYDYRDFGASGNVCRSTATMAEWGLRDQPAAQRELERLLPGMPIWVIGHSLGGLMLPFHEGAARVARFIAVASGPVHLSDHPLWVRAKIAAFWYGPGPIAAWLMGYLPGRRLGLGPDLPAGVYWQWRRWCTSRGFYQRELGKGMPQPHPAEVRCEAKFVAVADDSYVPPAVVWRLMQLYPWAKKRQLTLRPEDFGMQQIGHIAAFAPKNAALWPVIIA